MKGGQFNTVNEDEDDSDGENKDDNDGVNLDDNNDGANLDDNNDDVGNLPTSIGYQETNPDFRGNLISNKTKDNLRRKGFKNQKYLLVRKTKF